MRERVESRLREWDKENGGKLDSSLKLLPLTPLHIQYSDTVSPLL